MAKLNKRLAKKLQKTGRTSGKQKINRKAALPTTIAKPKVKAPEVDREALDKALRELEFQEFQKEYRNKQYFVNMITKDNDDLTEKQKREIEDAIWNADEATLEELNDIYTENEDWVDFYKYRNEYEAGYVDKYERMAALETVMDILGVAY